MFVSYNIPPAATGFVRALFGMDTSGASARIVECFQFPGLTLSENERSALAVARMAQVLSDAQAQTVARQMRENPHTLTEAQMHQALWQSMPVESADRLAPLCVRLQDEARLHPSAALAVGFAYERLARIGGVRGLF